MDDVSKAKDLLNRFCKYFGWKLEFYEDTCIGGCALQIKNKNDVSLIIIGELQNYFRYQDHAIRSTSEALCYKLMLEKIVGRRLLMYKKIDSTDVEYTGIFANTISELELKLAILGY